MGRVFAVSDLHGMYPLWKQIRDFLQPDDKLYVLGDCGDRGREGWKIITEVLQDPRVTYIRGNHEQMLLDAWRDEFMGEEYYLWMSNGGWETFDKMMGQDKLDMWLDQLNRTTKYAATYENKDGKIIHLTHAGFTPMEETFYPDKKELLWDRDHCWDKCDWWPEENPNDYVVHGHTPVRSSTFKYLIYGDPSRFEVNDSATVVRYAHGHKICIDAGCFATGKIALLDLDTFEEYLFEIPNFINM